MTDVAFPELDEPPAEADAMGIGRARDFDPGGFGDPFVVLPAESEPPPGIQAASGLWGLITLGGDPVAFISPELVVRLNPDAPVGTVLDQLRAAYAADFADQPQAFFRSWLDRDVRGQVVIVDQAFARRHRGRITTTDLGDAQCDLGQILPIGEICDDDCRCPRRAQRR